VGDANVKCEGIVVIIRHILIFMIPFLLLAFAGIRALAERDNGIKFNFEETTEGWKVPDWAYYQPDHVAKDVKVSRDNVLKGEGALEVVCDFPGNKWSAALIEIEKDMDLSGYSRISAGVYIPRSAPKGFFKARFVVTAGIGWHFIEMRESFSITPGRWVMIEAPIEKDEFETSAWKGRGEKRLFNHLDQVKKIAIRVEYDAAPPHTIGPSYHGPVYIDNVIIEK
jgi:hypothetical protein